MDFVAFVKTLFPIEGDGYRVELTGDPVAWIDGMLVVPMRMSIFDDSGVRDVKEQHVHVLPERHANERGRAFLEQAASAATSHSATAIELFMPHDLFCHPLLDTPVPIDEFQNVFSDPRAAAILEKRPEDRALLATIGVRRERPLRNPALEAAISERVDDPAAYAVYGDWLAERGDPRGELIALQIAGQDATALIDQYAWEFLGEFAWTRDNEAHVTWRWGFPFTIRIGSELDPSQYETSWQLREITFDWSMAYVQSIAIEASLVWSDDVFGTIGEHGLPQALRRLSVKTGEYHHIGNVAPAYPALANLHELRLESRSFELGDIDLPALRSLELVTRGLTKDNLASLRAGKLPSLETLVLWISDEGTDDCDVQDDDLDWLLAGEHFPKLKHLGLCGRANSEPLVGKLVDAPIVRRLEVLDLAGVWVGEAEGKIINANREKLAHLREIRLPLRHVRHAVELANLVDDERFVPVYE